MGKDLLQDVTEATGLPSDLISNELESLLKKSGHSAETLTIEQLRLILAEYLQDVFVEAQDSFEQNG